MTPLIGSENVFALAAVLAAGAAFAFWAERQRWGRKLSGPMWAILFGLALSNLGVVPPAAPAFSLVCDLLVPAAIPLLLFRADLRRILQVSGPMLLAFLLGVAGTVAGALLGFYVLPLGAEGAALTGAYTATYTGGSMNFVAVSKALGFEASSQYAAAIAADNLVSTLYLLGLVMLPAWSLARRWWPSPIMDEAGEGAGWMDEHDDHLRIDHLAIALALSLALCAAGQVIATWLGVPRYAILFITALALLAANLVPGQLARLKGDFALGMLFMNLFFVTVGAAAHLPSLLRDAGLLLPFALIIVGVHALVLLAGTRLLRIDLAEALTASNACVLGPSTAAAVAAGSGWRGLVTPAILVGVLGYAVANFLGVAIAGWLA
ncbi:MAG: DUF819 family protein [Xanthomonadales bacterium]|nr:DUF819 family protein [Xanthomonadales bacterium]